MPIFLDAAFLTVELTITGTISRLMDSYGTVVFASPFRTSHWRFRKYKPEGSPVYAICLVPVLFEARGLISFNCPIRAA
jgi:hypothetical protein